MVISPTMVRTYFATRAWGACFFAVLLWVPGHVNGETNTVTIGIVGNDSYEYFNDEQDYLALPGWTECPPGYVVSAARVTAYAVRNKNINHLQCVKADDAATFARVSAEEMHHLTIAEYLAKLENIAIDVKILYKNGKAAGYSYSLPFGGGGSGRGRQVVYPSTKVGDGAVMCPANSFVTGMFKRTLGTTDKTVTILRCQDLQGSYPDERSSYAVFLTDGVRMPTDTTMPPANDPAWGTCPAGSGAVGIVTIDHANGVDATEWSDAEIAIYLANVLGGPVALIGETIIRIITAGSTNDYFNLTERFLVCKTLPEPQPPQVSFLKPSPSGRIVTDASTIDITALATDDRGFENIVYPFQWTSNRTRDNGSAIQGMTQCYLGACTGKDIHLMTGRNEITFRAEDRDGAVGTATFVVERRAPVAPPKITIVVPTSQQTYATSEAELTLSAAVESNNGIQSVVWKNAQTGDSGNAAKTYGWVALRVPLVLGANVITYTATDNNGKIGTDSITVTRTPNNYTCAGGTLCNGKPVTGTPGQIVCGTTLRNYQCTPSGWKDLGTSCACSLPLPPLQTPANLKAAGSCSGTSPRITVSWGNVPTATQYEIHRKQVDSPLPYAEIVRTSNTSFVDTGVTAGKSYRYKVRARRASDGAVGAFQTEFAQGSAPSCKP